MIPGAGDVATNDTTMKDQEPVRQTPLSADKTSENAGTVRNPEEFDQLMAEANALALYVARHGDSLRDGSKTLYDQLLSAIEKAKSSPSTPHWRALMAAYAEVTAITYKELGINGRTILDTQNKISPRFLPWLFAPRNRPGVIGAALFAMALFFEVLMSWSGGVSDPGELTGIWTFGYYLIGALSTYLVPAAWGGIGACIFLMKRLSDKLFELAYEEARQRGDVTRIFLGAMLGVVIVVLFFPDFGEQLQLGSVNLAPRSVAFIAGLGVKPVYAGFEALSEELARRFKGSKAAAPK